MNKEIKVLRVEPGLPPVEKTIQSGLQSLQHEVGGYIECVYPFEDDVVLIVNEEGKINGLPLNRSLRDDEGEIYDVIAGSFIVAGITEDSFCSLDGELCAKYSNLFKYPEIFVSIDGKIAALPVRE